MFRFRKALAVSGLTLLVVACGPSNDGPSKEKEEGPAGPGISKVSITQNPNNRLSAIVEAYTDPPAPLTLQIRRDGETVQTLGPTKAAERHEINVLGLHADTDYDFKFSAEKGDDSWEQSESYGTQPLPDNFPPIEVKTSKPEQAADGIRLMSLYRWQKPGGGYGYDEGWGMIVGIDQTGEVVWYYKADHWTWNAYRLSNGNLLYIIADHAAVEIDMMGNVVNRWDSNEDLGRKPKKGTFGIHHSVIEQDDGNFVALSTELQKVEGFEKSGKKSNVIGDAAVEFNRKGEVLNTWTLFDVLSDYTTRRRYGSGGPKWNDEYGKDTQDWSHANALNFGDEPGTLIASLRHQDWVVKWDRETGDLLWRLGPEGDFEFPNGSDGEFNYHQHAPNWLENGNLILYDNGSYRESVEPGERFYTRVVEFELDASNVDIENGKKGTVKQVWESKRPPKYYAPHVGDAEGLPNDTIMISDGGLLENPKACHSFDKNGDPVNRTWSCIANPKNLNWARLVEVTHDKKKEKVLEVWIKDTSDKKPRGYTMYRAEYLDSLYPNGAADSSDGS